MLDILFGSINGAHLFIVAAATLTLALRRGKDTTMPTLDLQFRRTAHGGYVSQWTGNGYYVLAEHYDNLTDPPRWKMWRLDKLGGTLEFYGLFDYRSDAQQIARESLADFQAFRQAMSA